ncbi:hypothetical protein [Streptomyces sp. NPDC050988]|uniref:hypothetical protein n=1 Tax=Streptomyces sp. NPDC050988 TaxID=3365637 RepID=UPI00379001BC
MLRSAHVYSGSIPLFGSRCYRILDDDGVCELNRGHDGDCLPYEPGYYLPPPLITPLHILTLMWWHPRLVCLLCGTNATSVSCDGPVLVIRDFDGPESVECDWRFKPCGCEGREIVTAEELDTSLTPNGAT